VAALLEIRFIQAVAWLNLLQQESAMYLNVTSAQHTAIGVTIRLEDLDAETVCANAGLATILGVNSERLASFAVDSRNAIETCVRPGTTAAVAK